MTSGKVDSQTSPHSAVVDPDLQLGEGGGERFDLLAQLAFLPSVMSFFFTKNMGEGGSGPPGPLP